MPNPMAWYFHHLPPAFHRAEVALTFVEQLAGSSITTKTFLPQTYAELSLVACFKGASHRPTMSDRPYSINHRACVLYLSEKPKNPHVYNTPHL